MCKGSKVAGTRIVRLFVLLLGWYSDAICIGRLALWWADTIPFRRNDLQVCRVLLQGASGAHSSRVRMQDRTIRAV